MTAFAVGARRSVFAQNYRLEAPRSPAPAIANSSKRHHVAAASVELARRSAAPDLRLALAQPSANQQVPLMSKISRCPSSRLLLGK